MSDTIIRAFMETPRRMRGIEIELPKKQEKDLKVGANIPQLNYFFQNCNCRCQFWQCKNKF
jgi:hypothetical protein